MKKDRREEIESIVEYVLTNFKYGDMLSYDTLQRIIGYGVENIEFAYIMKRVKDELIEYGCILSTVFNEGFKILHPNEVVKEVYNKYAKLGVVRFAKGLKVMANIDQSLLNSKEKEQFLEMADMMNSLYKTSENNLLQMQFLIGEATRKELNK